jgi:hypothetical protein
MNSGCPFGGAGAWDGFGPGPFWVVWVEGVWEGFRVRVVVDRVCTVWLLLVSSPCARRFFPRILR